MKNILYLCSHNPFEIGSGAHQRSNLLCKSLAEFAHVDVVCFSEEDILINESNIPNCSIVCLEKREKRKVFPYIIILFLNIKRLLFVFSKQILATKDNYCADKLHVIMKEKDYDYVVVRYITTAIKWNIHFDKKVIIDLDDLPEQLYRTEKEKYCKNIIKKILQKLYFSIIEKGVRFHTKKIVAKVRYVYLPIKAQTSLFSNSVYLPNIPYPVLSEEIKRTDSIVAGNFEIMFIGKLSYFPNSNGIDYFLKQVWPIIIKEIPQAHFNIVGYLSSKEKKQYWESYKGVNVIGFVEDIVAEYRKNNIVIVPIYLGAGTNIKVLEAMYMGKACVITQYASRGFEDLLTDGDNILIAENEKDFAAKVIQLLKDDDLNKRIGENAKSTLKEEYSYNSLRKIVQNSITLN